MQRPNKLSTKFTTKLGFKLALSGAIAASLIGCGNSDVQTNANNAAQSDANLNNAEAITLFTNANVITMVDESATAQAVAIQGGKIIALGTAAGITQQYPNATTSHDLQGKTLLPGLIDTHGHLSITAQTVAAANVASPPVGNANTVDDVVGLLKEHANKHDGDGWLVGFGYDDSLLAEQRHPTKADLDKVSTDRPIGIIHVSAHFMSCNSKCLELAGIDADTENPEGGIIRRLPDSNEPDGVLEETAMVAVYKSIPQPDQATKLKLLQLAQNYYASHGITTVQDGAAQPADVDLYRTAADAGQLQLDVVAYPVLGYSAATTDNTKYEPDYINGFRVGGVKLVLDGSPQGKTAWLTKPYAHPPHGQDADYVGYPIHKTEKVNDFINGAFANGLPVLAHANGDAAADQLIDAVIAANQEHGNTDRRTVMIHAQTVRDDQLDSMLEQNIMPSYFSAHPFYWGDWHRDEVFGSERAERISPLKTTADKGLRFTTHNDTPVVPPDMMRLLWASVNRETRSGKTLGEAQKVSPYQALKSITIDAAYQYFEEDHKGSIEVGKAADLVVLDKNPLTIDSAEIKDIKVMMTVKDGEIIYTRQ